MDPHALSVCTTCTRLAGPVGDGLTQQCACSEVSDRWPGHDFALAFELCHCCTATLITSGSRWSPFHCSPCATGIREHNLAGGVFIPIGRHSLVNGTVRRGDAPPTGAPVFAARLKGMVSALDLVAAHRTREVRQILETAGWSEDGSTVPIDEYLHTASGIDRGAALERLVRSMTAPTDVGEPVGESSGPQDPG
jgi:hypothetical protein